MLDAFGGEMGLIKKQKYWHSRDRVLGNKDWLNMRCLWHPQCIIYLK